MVTWAESSAVNYGNSVLGVRVNRMATGMEILCAIAGKVPVFGVLTDEGRKAKWHIDVRLSKEPHWGALGGAIGTKVVEQIPTSPASTSGSAWRTESPTWSQWAS